MRTVRWLLIGLLYAAAELASPLAIAPAEALEAEAEEAVQLAGRQRGGRLGAARRAPRLPRITPVALRPRPPVSRRRATLDPAALPRRAPALLAASPPAPDDH
jgi:hypothetical protein